MKMKSKITFIWQALGPFKGKAMFLFAILLLAAVSEALGLGMIIPFLSVFVGEQSTADGGTYVELLNNGIDSVFGSEYRLLGVCLILFSLYILKNLMYIARIGYSMYFTNSLREYWTNSILTGYLSTSYSKIIAQKKGALINNLVPEPVYASKAIKFLAGFIAQAILALALIITMFMVNWPITLAVMIIASLIFVFVFKKTKKYSIAVGNERITLNQSIHTQAEEVLNGFRQVKLYSLEGKVAAAIRKDLNRVINITTKFTVIESLAIPVGETLVIGGLIGTLIYIQYFTEMSVGAVLPTIGFFLIICYRLFRVLSNLFSQRMSLLSFMPSLKLVNSLINEDNGAADTQHHKRTTEATFDGDISFENISFSYPNSEQVLNSANMTVGKGQVTALIGKSGAGKSTLLDLLSGFYGNYDGRIMIGDTELREIDLQSWRSIVGFVSQDTFIFNTTVRENIMFGNSQATEEDVFVAAREASAYEFIMALPKGFDTMLGDRGMGISGGERQRIAIARALVRDPELLIFDEATSALDKESQKLIKEMIGRMKGKKTILIIAHSYSFVSNADQIFRVESGQITSLGSYKDFIKMNTGTDL